MTAWLESRITDFTQGYIDKIDDTELPAGSLKNCRNVISRQIGKLVSRGGQAKLNGTEMDSSNPVQGMHTFYSGNLKYLVAAVNGVVYACTPPVGIMNQIKTGLDTVAPIMFVTVNVNGVNQVVGFNGVDTPFKWDGTTVTDLCDYRVISREVPTTSDNTVYTLANKPIRTGTAKTFVFSNTELVNETDYTIDAEAGTITFDVARINAVTDKDSDDAKTTVSPLNGRIESLHPYKVGCTITVYDKNGNVLKALSDETSVDNWRADYASGVIYAPVTTGSQSTIPVDTVVADEAPSPLNNFKTFQVANPFKVGVVPVIKDKNDAVLTPAGINYALGTVTFASSQETVSPLKVSYTWVDETPLYAYEPIATTYEWADVIKVDYQYSNGTVSGKFRYPATYGGRIFVMGGDERIYWSDITQYGSEYEAWPQINNWPVDVGAGEDDGCLRCLLGDLYVFKTRSIHRFRGTDLTDFRLDPVDLNVGCAGPQAACLFESDIYFISEQGLYKFNGQTAINMSRDRIPLLWDRINKAALGQSAAYAWHGLILFSLPLDDSTVNDLVIAYDTSMGAMWPWDGMGISMWEEISTTSGSKLYAGSSLDGFVLEQDAGTDDAGVNIISYLELPSLDAGAADRLKTARYVYVEYGVDQVTFGKCYASKSNAAYLELVARNADKNMRKFALRPTIQGWWRYMGIKIQHDTADGLEIRSILMPYKIKPKSSVKGAL
jgi:hypothetical protein